MSLRGKKWVIKNKKELPVFDKILENRTFSLLDDLLEFHDPYLFRDMDRVIQRIEKAIKEKERIIIFGDYDVDGITGTAILYNIFSDLNAEISYRIPNREKDGYGISDKFIDEFIEKDIKLIISVDCGISCASQVTKAKEHNIDTIITDHHTIPKNFPSDSYAVLHPKEKDSNYPYSELTGAGVALKLAHALIIKFFPDKIEEKLFSLLDLASMGTVADLGPLDGENRLIVKEGLKAISNTKWEGLKKIMEFAGINRSQPLDTSSIGFKIGPRINAAGRISNPYIALNLLIESQDKKKLHTLGQTLETLNTTRQKMTEQALYEANQLVQPNQELPFILLVHDPKWHVGILGLIAGRLVEKYNRPVIAMQDLGDTLVGSARSPEFFNIVEALEHSKEHLKSFGGHSAAAGFNLKKENLKNFKTTIEKFARKTLRNKDLRPSLEIDCTIKEQDINFNLFDKISTLEPFGIKNNRPVLLIKNIEPLFVEQVGKQRNHLKFAIQLSDKKYDAIAFNMGHHAESIRRHRKIDLVFHLDKNVWNNSVRLQLQTLDIGFKAH